MAERIVNVKIRTDAQTKELTSYRQQILQTDKEVKKLRKTIREQGGATKAQAKQLALAETKLKAQKNAYRDLEATILKNNDALRKNSGFVAGVSKGVQDAALKIGAAIAAFQALTRVVGGALSVMGNFEQAQANLNAVTNFTSKELETLKNQAKDLGETTVFTATEVTGLQTELAKLGFTQKEIEGATEATLQLAAATGSDLSEAASVVGSNIRAFGLNANEAGRVADVMARSFQTSALDMEKFSTAMRSVAPVAKNAGVSIEETTALLGKISDSGVDASTAGTALRNIFLELSKQGLTFEDAMTQINKATDKNAVALELFGKRGATVATIVAENSEGIGQLTKELENAAGTAEDSMNVQLDTMQGKFKLLGSAVEGALLRFDESLGITEAIGAAFEFLSRNIDTVIKAIGVAAAAFITFKTETALANRGVNLLSLSFLKSAKNLNLFQKGTRLAGRGFRAFTNLIRTNPIGILVTVIGTAITALSDFGGAAESAAEAQERLNAAVQEGVEKQQELIDQRKEQTSERFKQIEAEVARARAKGLDEEQVKLIEIRAIENKRQELISQQNKALEQSNNLRGEALELTSKVQEIDARRKDIEEELSSLGEGQVRMQLTQEERTRKFITLKKELNRLEEERVDAVAEQNAFAERNNLEVGQVKDLDTQILDLQRMQRVAVQELVKLRKGERKEAEKQAKAEAQISRLQRLRKAVAELEKARELGLVDAADIASDRFVNLTGKIADTRQEVELLQSALDVADLSIDFGVDILKDIPGILERTGLSLPEFAEIFETQGADISTTLSGWRESMNTIPSTAEGAMVRTRDVMSSRAPAAVEPLKTSTDQTVEDVKLSYEDLAIANAQLFRSIGQLSEVLGDQDGARQAALIEVALNTGIAVSRGILAAQSVGFPANIPAIITTVASIVTGMGQAIAIINQAELGMITPETFHAGGMLRGPRHSQGGIPFTVGGRPGFEAEGGEAIINRKSTAMFTPLLSAINQAGGGVAFESGGMIPKKFATGGVPIPAEGFTFGGDTGMGMVADRIINGINDKKVINVASETASVASRVQQRQTEFRF